VLDPLEIAEYFLQEENLMIDTLFEYIDRVQMIEETNVKLKEKYDVYLMCKSSINMIVKFIRDNYEYLYDQKIPITNETFGTKINRIQLYDNIEHKVFIEQGNRHSFVDREKQIWKYGKAKS